MVWGGMFSRLLEESPVAVMVVAVMERVFSPKKIDAIFAGAARFQYERELLFSTVVALMSQVVCGTQPSERTAYCRPQLLHGGLPLLARCEGRGLRDPPPRQAGLRGDRGERLLRRR
jgi:hypothetical protein